MRHALLDLIGGFRLSQMIAIVARLRIADHLRDGPRLARVLAQATDSHPDALYRVLRTLASIGLFAEEGPDLFRPVSDGEWLCSDVPGNVRVAAEVVGEEWMWRPWGALAHTVRTGETAFDALYGEDTWRGSASIPTRLGCSTASWTKSLWRMPRRSSPASTSARTGRLWTLRGARCVVGGDSPA